jgi:hypothetical protein
MKNSNTLRIAIVILLTPIVSSSIIYCQKAKQDIVAGIPVNYDEALTGTYTLPDPLIFPDGKKVKNARQWYKKRRLQIEALFEKFQYGKVPAAPKDLSFNVFDQGTPALNGTALRKVKNIRLQMSGEQYRHGLGGLAGQWIILRPIHRSILKK